MNDVTHVKYTVDRTKIEHQLRESIVARISERPDAWDAKCKWFDKYRKDIKANAARVEYLVKSETDQLVQDLRNYPEYRKETFMMFGKAYTIIDITTMLLFSSSHDPGKDGCSKDLKCLKCGRPICLDCCHWSPLLYTHPEDVYCPSCCPSCRLAEDIGAIPDELKEEIMGLTESTRR